MTSVEPFPESYYCTRNYRDYLTRKFDALGAELMEGVLRGNQILDFGCGYGGLVDALYRNGYSEILGTDISQWAIEEGHRRYPHLVDRLQFYNRDLLRRPQGVVLMLDVLEHMPMYELEAVLRLSRMGVELCLMVRIPVCAHEGERFVLPVSNNDPTHICCHTSEWWNKLFEAAGFSLVRKFSGKVIYDSPGVLAAVYQ